MECLSVRRLTATESNILAAEMPNSDDPLPDYLQIKAITAMLGVADRTLVRYRKLAFECVAEYWAIAVESNPNIFNSEMPDIPPLTKRQVEILKEINELYQIFRNTKMVKGVLARKYKSPADL